MQLMNLIASGDECALGEFYDRHAGIAYGLALRVVREPGLAEDAVQEGFLSVWRSAGSFDSRRGAPRNWLLTLVHRRAVDLVQRNQRYRELNYEQASQPLSPSAAETVELNTERRKVQVALAALPAKQRTALELAYYGGYTQREIATRLQLPIGTVKGQIFHGLKRLRNLLLEPEAPNCGAFEQAAGGLHLIGQECGI